MGQLTIAQPSVGQPDTTEDVKVINAFTAIQTLVNGGLDPYNLSAASTGFRKLLLEASGYIPAGLAAGAYLLCPGGTVLGSGVNTTSGSIPALWAGDAGLSGQPTDFQLSPKTSYCRVRATVANNTASNLNLTVGLVAITSVAGAAGSINYTFTTPGVVVTTVATFLAGSAGAVESAQVAMPASGTYGLYVSVGVIPANTCLHVTAQLYGYAA